MTVICGVIFDVDGTLVDSNDAHAHAWVRAMAEQGHQVSFDRVRSLIGMGSDKLLPEALNLEVDSPEGKRLSRRRSEIFKADYLPSLQPFPGVRALLERMRAAGFKLVVASSAKTDELKPLLEAAGAADMIEQRTSSDDADNSKPDPDIVQAALQQLGCPANAVIMVGDTPYDVAAARQAGIPVIAFRCGGWSDQELAGAIAIYNDPADLLARFETSPLVSVPNEIY